MKSITLLLLCAGMAGIASAQTADPPLLLKFASLRPDTTIAPVYIAFGGAGVLDATNLRGGATIAKGVTYTLDQLNSGVAVRKADRIRVYVSLGSPLSSPSAANQYAANYSDPTRSDFATRWDQFELNYASREPNRGEAHLTSQEFFGVPLQITAQGGGIPASKLTWHQDAAVAFEGLGRLSSFAPLTLANPQGAIVTGRHGVEVKTETYTGNVIRILGPGTVRPKNAAGATVYPSYANYLTYLRTRHRLTPGLPVDTLIAGNNGLLPDGKLQTYSVKATFAATPYQLLGTAINAGDLVLNGTVNNGAGPLPLTILMRVANLTDSAISRHNVEYSLLAGSNVNSVVARINTDFLTGLNLGLVGSTVDNPSLPGSTIGESPSWTWFGNRPDGIKVPALTVTSCFAAAEPNNDGRYDRYASLLANAAETYSLPFLDRLQAPSARLVAGSTLTLSVLSDVKPVVDVPGPKIVIANAATYAAGERIAPGSIAVLWGDLPTGYDVSAPGSGVPLPSQLPGLTVRFNNGLHAPLFLANSQVAAFQVPWELGDTALESVMVIGPDGERGPFPVRLAAFAPGLFMTDIGTRQGLIFDLQGQIADARHPATTGEELVIYATGLGPVNHSPGTGAPAALNMTQTTILTPSVSVGGVNAPVVYAGLSPGSVGYYQVRVRVPAGGQRGLSVPVKLSVGGAASNIVSAAICDHPCAAH